MTTVTGAATGNETYTYDPLDRTRRTVLNGVDRRFHVNATTQRLSQITTVGSADVVDYLWNDRGELSSRNTSRPGNPTFTSPTIWRNGFEENTITTLEPMTFDRAGRLIAYNGSFTHQYDAHGRRVASVVPMWGTRYQVYDRQGELRYVEDVGRAERIEFFSLNGTLVAQRSRPLSSETATISYLHSDHRGTPSVKSATGGTVDYRSRLKPYGAPYDGIWRDGPGFTEHAMDEIGELVYMQQRYYDPMLPGFLSPDPLQRTADDFNPYQYARSNPYSYVDPDGRWAHIIIGGAVGGVFGGGVEIYRQVQAGGDISWGDVAIQTGKGIGVGALTAAVPSAIASGSLSFGGAVANVAVSTGNAAAVGAVGEIGAQLATGRPVDAQSALAAGAANAAGLAAGQAIAPLARTMSTTIVPGSAGLPVQSLSGRTFQVGASAPREFVSPLMQQTIQDTVGASSSPFFEKKFSWEQQ